MQTGGLRGWQEEPDTETALQQGIWSPGRAGGKARRGLLHPQQPRETPKPGPGTGTDRQPKNERPSEKGLGTRVPAGYACQQSTMPLGTQVHEKPQAGRNMYTITFTHTPAHRHIPPTMTQEHRHLYTSHIQTHSCTCMYVPAPTHPPTHTRRYIKSYAHPPG